MTAIGLRQDLRGIAGMARLLVPDHLALVVLRRAAAADGRRVRDRLADLGLSPAETRLALLMDGSRSLVQAAEILGIRHETARSQLRQVFAKLGLSRQSELAVFVLRLRITPEPERSGQDRCRCPPGFRPGSRPRSRRCPDR